MILDQNESQGSLTTGASLATVKTLCDGKSAGENKKQNQNRKIQTGNIVSLSQIPKNLFSEWVFKDPPHIWYCKLSSDSSHQENYERKNTIP